MFYISYIISYFISKFYFLRIIYVIIKTLENKIEYVNSNYNDHRT